MRGCAVLQAGVIHQQLAALLDDVASPDHLLEVIRTRAPRTERRGLDEPRAVADAAPGAQVAAGRQLDRLCNTVWMPLTATL